MVQFDSVSNFDDNLLERFEELKDREAAGVLGQEDNKELNSLRRRFGLRR
jgi:hypothetical protein